MANKELSIWMNQEEIIEIREKHKGKIPKKILYGFVHEALISIVQGGDEFRDYIVRDTTSRRYMNSLEILGIDEIEEYNIREGALVYFTRHHNFDIAAEIAAILNKSRLAKECSERWAKKQDNLEEKADWFIKAAGYAARLEDLNDANRLFDLAVDCYLEAEKSLTPQQPWREKSFLVMAAWWSYPRRKRKLEDSFRFKGALKNSPYGPEPRASLPEEPLIPIENLERAIELYEQIGGNKSTLDELREEKEKLTVK
jgi:hypothetical protein